MSDFGSYTVVSFYQNLALLLRSFNFSAISKLEVVVACLFRIPGSGISPFCFKLREGVCDWIFEFVFVHSTKEVDLPTGLVSIETSFIFFLGDSA